MKAPFNLLVGVAKKNVDDVCRECGTVIVKYCPVRENSMDWRCQDDITIISTPRRKGRNVGSIRVGTSVVVLDEPNDHRWRYIGQKVKDLCIEHVQTVPSDLFDGGPNGGGEECQ